MQIQFKQNEIEDAIRGYIIKQGISLKERQVSITFTAGRSGNGLSAEAIISKFIMPEEEEILIELKIEPVVEPKIEPMVEPKAIPSEPILQSEYLEKTQFQPENPVPVEVVPVPVPVPVFAFMPEAKAQEPVNEEKLATPVEEVKALTNLFG